MGRYIILKTKMTQAIVVQEGDVIEDGKGWIAVTFDIIIFAKAIFLITISG